MTILQNIPERVTKTSPVKKIARWWSKEFKVILAEFVSTTLLVFLGCMANIPLDDFTVQPPMYGPIAFGLVVLFNITSFGHISGAHMNPSVTLSAIIWGSVSFPLAVMYVIAQCSGAIIGYGLLLTVSPIDLIPGSVCITQPHVNHATYQSLIVEIVLSTALGFINCAVWDPVNKEKQDAIPLKFGFTIAALSLAGGPLTGASMNPARSLGPAVWTGNWNTHWVYWLGPALGGAIAPLLYKIAWLENKQDKESEIQSINGQL
ncbi:aquaporin AQPAn.G-like [Maniola jurtina]|uniref:aquaporin AQPAn.G-like n=1 Tax=Maniola jurtina TaxID=191418 RepID=UPI001E68F4B1|nr:aquaporin AQPAn.G-like [Maniola jurtina]